jgi:hypothetical protein
MADLRTIAALLVVICVSATAAAQPAASEKSTPAFSSAVPSGTSWTVTIRTSWEMSGKRLVKTPGTAVADAGAQPKELVKIENTYAGGVRREILHYRDGSSLTRYVTRGKVFHMDPISGEPVMESTDAQPTSGPVHGVSSLEELAWVSDRYYEGEGEFAGRPCRVYRQYAPDWSMDTGMPPEENGPSQPGLPRAQVKNPAAEKVLATAYLDRNTLQPVALETLYATWLYSDFTSAIPFLVPANLQTLARAMAEAAAEQAARYKVRP